MRFITTHVLDNIGGKPAAQISVVLQFRADATAPWKTLAQDKTNEDGRVEDLLPEGHPRQKGFYQFIFDTSAFSTFFPEVIIQFKVNDLRQHYHVPLLLSRYGYTTYRGS